MVQEIATEFGRMVLRWTLNPIVSWKCESFKIQHDVRPLFYKLKNRYFSAIIQPIAMKFGSVTHRQSLKPTGTWKFLFFWNPRWRTAEFLKLKNKHHHFSAMVHAIYNEIWQKNAQVDSEAHRQMEFWIIQNSTRPTAVIFKINTRMWANAQRDGRPAEYRWRPLFNAAQFGWRPLL